MTDDPYQPPTAALRPEPAARLPAGNRAAAASLGLGGGSVLLASFALLESGRPVNLRIDLEPILFRIYALAAVAGLAAATALICGIIGWNSGCWPRALFGIVLAILGAALGLGIAASVALSGAW